MPTQCRARHNDELVATLDESRGVSYRARDGDGVPLMPFWLMTPTGRLFMSGGLSTARSVSHEKSK